VITISDVPLFLGVKRDSPPFVTTRNKDRNMIKA